MKVKRPPYRLYVIVDQKNKIFYLVEWEHKNHQRKIIDKLKNKLSSAIEFGIENIWKF